MSSFTPASSTPTGSFGEHPEVGFIGTYDELDVAYDESSHIFDGVHGVWRYDGFFAAFSEEPDLNIGTFTGSTSYPSGVFNPS